MTDLISKKEVNSKRHWTFKDLEALQHGIANGASNRELALTLNRSFLACKKKRFELRQGMGLGQRMRKKVKELENAPVVTGLPEHSSQGEGLNALAAILARIGAEVGTAGARKASETTQAMTVDPKKATAAAEATNLAPADEGSNNNESCKDGTKCTNRNDVAAGQTPITEGSEQQVVQNCENPQSEKLIPEPSNLELSTTYPYNGHSTRDQCFRLRKCLMCELSFQPVYRWKCSSSQTLLCQDCYSNEPYDQQVGIGRLIHAKDNMMAEADHIITIYTSIMADNKRMKEDNARVLAQCKPMVMKKQGLESEDNERKARSASCAVAVENQMLKEQVKTLTRRQTELERDVYTYKTSLDRSKVELRVQSANMVENKRLKAEVESIRQKATKTALKNVELMRVFNGLDLRQAKRRHEVVENEEISKRVKTESGS